LPSLGTKVLISFNSLQEMIFTMNLKERGNYLGERIAEKQEEAVTIHGETTIGIISGRRCGLENRVGISGSVDFS